MPVASALPGTQKTPREGLADDYFFLTGGGAVEGVCVRASVT